MLEFLAGFVLAGGMRSRTPKTPLTDKEKRAVVAVRVVLVVSLFIMFWLMWSMMVNGPGWNPVEHLMSYIPTGWTFWTASILTALVSGILSLVEFPFAGVVFRLTFGTMMVAMVPTIANSLVGI